MPTGTTNIVQCRWDQVEVGDTVMDPQWRWQRWIRISKIERDSGRIAAWYDPATHYQRGYETSGSSLVEVQVVS